MTFGAHFVEMLTEEIYQKSLEKILEIEKMGGSMKAIEAGYQQREIRETAWTHLTEVESVKENCRDKLQGLR